MLDWGRAGEEGTQNLSDTGQARCVVAGLRPLLSDRRLWEEAGNRPIVAEQLEVEGVGDLVFAPLWDRGDPFQKRRKSGVGGGEGWRPWLGRSFRDPWWGGCPRVFEN